MSKCELCGEESDSTRKVKIEGARLSVCKSCSEMGEEVSTGSKKVRKNRRSTGKKKGDKKVLKNSYGETIKEAREEKGISLGELADSLNEKSSLISKIEKEDLKPDKPLAGKLEKELGVELYTIPEVNDYDSGNSSDSRKATLEDVADVKD